METKYLHAEIKAAKTGEFEAILSAPTLDRDGEIIDPKAFLPLPERITIDVDHGLSAEKTIGSAVPFYDGELLKAKGTFASTELAQTIRTLVVEGHVGHMSVAFRAVEREVDEKDGLPHIRKAELLNAAVVAIPANREAQILVAKAAKVGARNSAKDAERIQSMHDHAVELGAVCSEKNCHGMRPVGFTVGERGTETIVMDIDGRKMASSLVDYSREAGALPLTTKSADTEAPVVAADEAATAGAEVDRARANADIALLEAEIALLL